MNVPLNMILSDHGHWYSPILHNGEAWKYRIKLSRENSILSQIQVCNEIFKNAIRFKSSICNPTSNLLQVLEYTNLKADIPKITGLVDQLRSLQLAPDAYRETKKSLLALFDTIYASGCFRLHSTLTIV